VYSLTSLSLQPRFSPPVATGRIFFHVIYLINSPPSRLALANWWIDNDLCKLLPTSRHSLLVVASLGVLATAHVCVSGRDRARSSRYQSVAELWPSVRLPLPLTIRRLKSCCQQRLWDVNDLWLTTQKGEGRTPIMAFIRSTGVLL